MPVDFKVLKKFGCDNDALREIFTAERPSDTSTLSEDAKKAVLKKVEIRERWEKRDLDRLNGDIAGNLQNYALYAACDLAWDASPINKMTIPLMLYAQGKINISSCAGQLSSLDCASAFLKKDGSGKVVGIDLPKFVEVSINYVRSVVTRRLAVQSNKYNNLWPFYKYEPRATGLIGKIRSDVLSQVVDVIVDQYDYRHHDTQVFRDTFLYSHSVDFVRSPWEVEKQWEFEPIAEELVDADNRPVRAVIVKQGVAFVNPHPTRVFWDRSFALSSINSDTGCRYIGFWDVMRYGDLSDNPTYFNRDKIKYSSNLWDVYSQNIQYFNQYLSTLTVPPSYKVSGDFAGTNDRKSQIGLYAADQKQASIYVTEVYDKINPKSEGIGDYPFDVWIHRTVASDNTTVFAEWMPSTPACYCGYNENDSRQANISMAHTLMPYQDMISSLVTNMLLTIQSDLLTIIGLNTDVINPAHIDGIRKQLQGRNYSVEPVVVEYSVQRLEELGLKPSQMMVINQTRTGQSVTQIIQGIGELVQLVERLEAMSPAEQGQPAPREISAKEVSAIESTTTGVSSFISDSLDEYRAAKKRIVYESIVCCYEGDIKAPVVNRYSAKVIEKAGFKPLLDESESFSDGTEMRKQTVIGTRRNLVHDYIFSSRDGAERAVNTQSANTLVQMLNILLTVPGIMQAIGKEKLYDIMNEIFRMSGAGLDLNLELKEGDDNSMGEDNIAQLQQALQQLADAVKQNSSSLAEQEQVNQHQEESLKGLNELAKHVQKMAADIQKIQSTPQKDDVNETLSYKDAPPSVRRQIEHAAGYIPATEDETVEV